MDQYKKQLVKKMQQSSAHTVHKFRCLLEITTIMTSSGTICHTRFAVNFHGAIISLNCYEIGDGGVRF